MLRDIAYNKLIESTELEDTIANILEDKIHDIIDSINFECEYSDQIDRAFEEYDVETAVREIIDDQITQAVKDCIDTLI